MWGIICAVIIGIAELWFLIKASIVIEEAEAEDERRKQLGLPALDRSELKGGPKGPRNQQKQKLAGKMD